MKTFPKYFQHPFKERFARKLEECLVLPHAAALPADEKHPRNIPSVVHARAHCLGDQCRERQCHPSDLRWLLPRPRQGSGNGKRSLRMRYTKNA